MIFPVRKIENNCFFQLNSIAKEEKTLDFLFENYA